MHEIQTKFILGMILKIIYYLITVNVSEKRKNIQETENRRHMQILITSFNNFSCPILGDVIKLQK